MAESKQTQKLLSISDCQFGVYNSSCQLSALSELLKGECEGDMLLGCRERIGLSKILEGIAERLYEVWESDLGHQHGVK